MHVHGNTAVTRFRTWGGRQGLWLLALATSSCRSLLALSSLMANTEGFRLVRCPRCLLILPEPPNVTVYKCGGCGILLRAKIRASNGQHVAAKLVRQDSDNYSVATTSSSRSGTIVSSTAYTFGASRSSSLSSGISVEAALELDELDLELELRLGTPDKKDDEFAQPIKEPHKETEEILKEMRMERIESLVQEFFRGPSENRSILGGGSGMSALERWFSELGVSWVLQLNVGCAFARQHPPLSERSWLRALTQVMETIHVFVGMPPITISEEEVESGEQATSQLDPLQFALFFQEAITKMLVFVDVLFSKSLCTSGRVDPASECVGSYLDIYGALCKALSGIRLQFHSLPSAEVETIEKEIVSLLSAKQGKAFDAIWSFMEERRTLALNSIEEYSSGTQTPQRSCGIHKVTDYVMEHINFLLYNESTVTLLVSQAASLGKYVPQTRLGEAPSLNSLIAETVSCLEEKLIIKSQLFLDQGLRFLFLLNNSNFIQALLKDSRSYIKVDEEIVLHKLDELGHYIESYIQVSWAPMLSCLFKPTPWRQLRKYSPLSKFESEFQKIYTSQKMWKVPDPELRKSLRKAVIEKIIPGYTKYIEDSKVTNPKFTPQELEEMLQELFEG